MSCQQTTLVQNPVTASNFQHYSPKQLNARREIVRLKKLADKSTDETIAKYYRRTANDLYREFFGYDAKKLKQRIIDLLRIWRGCGLTEKEIIEELKISKSEKPRSDFQNAFMELIGEGKVFVLHTPDMPHQFGNHSYEVYSVK